MRRAAAISSWSPTSCPSESLTTLNRSRSMKSTPTFVPSRPAWARANSSRSRSIVRLARPVRWSWRAMSRMPSKRRALRSAALTLLANIENTWRSRFPKRTRPRKPIRRVPAHSPCTSSGATRHEARPMPASSARVAAGASPSWSSNGSRSEIARPQNVPAMKKGSPCSWRSTSSWDHAHRSPTPSWTVSTSTNSASKIADVRSTMRRTMSSPSTSRSSREAVSRDSQVSRSWLARR